MKVIKYKVIAEYPDMIFELGQEIICYENGRTYVTHETKVNLADYPHLFKEMREYDEPEPTIAHQVATGLAPSNSLDGCPFHYCDKKPICVDKCRYDN